MLYFVKFSCLKNISTIEDVINVQIYEATVKRKYLIVVLLTGSSLESPSNNLLNAIPTIPGDICSNACGILKSISCHSNPKEGENSVYEKRNCRSRRKLCRSYAKQ